MLAAMAAQAALWGIGGCVAEREQGVHLTDEQRLDWLRLIRSQNVGPRGIMAQTPEAFERRRPK
jgi:hypothetical protein